MSAPQKPIPPHLRKRLAQQQDTTALTVVTSPVASLTEDEPPRGRSLVRQGITTDMTSTELVQHEAIRRLRAEVEEAAARCEDLETENGELKQAVHCLEMERMDSPGARGNLTGYASSDDTGSHGKHNSNASRSRSAGIEDKLNIIAQILANYDERMTRQAILQEKLQARVQQLEAKVEAQQRSGVVKESDDALPNW